MMFKYNDPDFLKKLWMNYQGDAPPSGFDESKYPIDPDLAGLKSLFPINHAFRRAFGIEDSHPYPFLQSKEAFSQFADSLVPLYENAPLVKTIRDVFNGDGGKTNHFLDVDISGKPLPLAQPWVPRVAPPAGPGVVQKADPAFPPATSESQESRPMKPELHGYVSKQDEALGPDGQPHTFSVPPGSADTQANTAFGMLDRIERDPALNKEKQPTLEEFQARQEMTRKSSQDYTNSFNTHLGTLDQRANLSFPRRRESIGLYSAQSKPRANDLERYTTPSGDQGGTKPLPTPN